MKKNIFILFGLIFSSAAFSQVGINTADPKATFDIIAKDSRGTSTTPEGLLIPRVDRERAESMFGVAISTLIYVNDVKTGLQKGSALNIDSIGYYYFDGLYWVKLNTDSAINPLVNIYNSDGILTTNRIVDQEDKTLTFTGTRVNSFSVAGDTFSVDAANKSIGIGTINPLAKVDVVGDRFGIKRSAGSGSWDNLWFDVGSYGPSINASGAENGIDFKVGANASGTYGDGNQVLTTVATMRPEGNMGIGTTTPNVNAILELNATNRGFLPPRLTTVQRNAIPAASKPAGLMVYNTNTNCMEFWNSSSWVSTCAVTAPVAGAITAVTCASATNNGTLSKGVAVSGVTSVIPYTGGNGGSHGGQTITSTGVTGLTATLAAGSFANGNGTLTYTITGTPSGDGNANFAINIGGRTCTLTRAVIVPVGTIASLNCAGATNNGTLTSRVAASGITSVISYTGGNAGTYTAQTVTSTGVTGLTATLAAGTLANGNGTFTYTITGTPTSAGTASFAINVGGRSCVLTRTVAGAATPPSGSTACTANSFKIPFAATNGSTVSGTINGVPVNATVSYTNIISNSTSPCGQLLGGGYQMAANAPSNSRLKIKFDKKISNLKINTITAGGSSGHIIYFRNGGTAINPTSTSLSSSPCSSTLYNLVDNYGGLWFDEVEIVFSNSNTPGIIFSFCVGDVQ
ncbi:hypothetical protein [Chryseobacterium polytrichastri]|uniref:Uncharacterized protein n=1 Tax=Chryseobacterium polytrichastri TaxID=1302687 RepID=A0A1M6PI34_9FLAO|nr:hypothetical protein [Chryseobacterium polytrichastri]SHK07573.1 hypothetical protein SAMN05444267_100115 [Chryseobacterium polytrichastri]